MLHLQHSSPATVEQHHPPPSLRPQAGVHEIELVNTGSGLGFGLVEFKGKGVAVKTIVKGGAAATVRIAFIACS